MSDLRIEAGRGVVLRRLNAADLSRFQAYRQDPDVGRYQDWARMDDGQARGFLDQMAQVSLFQRGQWSQIGIDLDGQLIGDMGVFVDDADPMIEIGVTLARDAQGRGLGFAAVRGFIAYGFEVLRVERILAGADPRNGASIALMERLGMQRLGLREGDVEYILHKADFH